jgi:hypothetical protein
MRKLNLSLDSLVVESFVAEDAAALRGTVQGHNSFQAASCPTLYCGTCQFDTCQYTEGCATYGETVCAGSECTSVSDTPTGYTCYGAGETCAPMKTCIPPE